MERTSRFFLPVPLPAGKSAEAVCDALIDTVKDVPATVLKSLTWDQVPWLLQSANVLHQCGAASLEQGRRHADTLSPELRARYWVSDFIGPELPDVLALALALADIVISRSGAGTLAELTALGNPSILIPLASSAGNEQTHNAQHLERSGTAFALVKENATAERLRAAREPVIASPERRTHMAGQARSLGRPDAAAQLTTALLLLMVLTGRGRVRGAGGLSRGSAGPGCRRRTRGPR
ncbi:glycosyltransferase [Streptomyces sp. ACA25]|uniref:UDP-N-acetylglucosamine--N-acetylmuramyl- (pentapeptide) pyrophosphoryl-undecaprenol N-acetylglucosamine transferase n=1 Tax=Streptomyces sp. ACA25 TaxID=3022596 RepID=UPI0023081852|nr:glycosyltransferase [Streptomyces sp. ACA25]MDB1087607.1 glycosyltransferase [Streptomyces sp. ACA25]